MTDADVDGSHIRTLLLTFFFRHMQDLIKRGNIFIAQPPLYSIRKGKSQQYIKDHREYVKVMVRRAAEGMVVRYGEGAARLEGTELSRFMTTLNEFLGFFDKVSKRLREEAVASLLPKIGIESKKAEFVGEDKKPPRKLAELEREVKALAKQLQFKSVESRFDEEHDLWEVAFTNSQGAVHVINWELAASAEYRQMMNRYEHIGKYLQPPFVVEVKAHEKAEAAKQADEELSDAEKAEMEKAEKKTSKPTRRSRTAGPDIVEKNTPRELFDYVLNEGTKEYIVQRYKGLGEMSAEQLWQTTMNPERRTLLSVKLEDIAETETIFTTLMGDDVESRRKFIEDNALDVKNLDI
jgi:DNA gyrase subunit B